MAKDKRIYVVEYGPAPGIEARMTTLVRASSENRAVRHVAENMLQIEGEYADQEQLADLLKKGATIIDAKESS